MTFNKFIGQTVDFERLIWLYEYVTATRRRRRKDDTGFFFGMIYDDESIWANENWVAEKK